MYMMVGIDMKRFPAFSNDMEFVEQLISEKSVFCLPGKCFGVQVSLGSATTCKHHLIYKLLFQDFIRIVITIPNAEIPKAVERIVAFCNENVEKQSTNAMNRRVSAFLPGGTSGM